MSFSALTLLVVLEKRPLNRHCSSSISSGHWAKVAIQNTYSTYLHVP